MTGQLELLSRKPIAVDSDVALLKSTLRQAGGWLKADYICGVTGWHDRKLRAVANATDGVVISGQLGYCHIANASLDEAEHAANWLESQAVAMGDRARAIRRQIHAHNRSVAA